MKGDSSMSFPSVERNIHAWVSAFMRVFVRVLFHGSVYIYIYMYGNTYSCENE